MKKRQIGKLGLMLLAGILMAGCGKTKEEAKTPKYTIGVVTKSKSSEYWMSVCSGMEDAAEKENAEEMKEKNSEVWKEVYEDFYGIPLEYTTTPKAEQEQITEQETQI